jgi:hypothetical protein
MCQSAKAIQRTRKSDIPLMQLWKNFKSYQIKKLCIFIGSQDRCGRAGCLLHLDVSGNIRQCFSWTCIQHRGLSCTWTRLDNRSRCCLDMSTLLGHELHLNLYYSSLCFSCTCLQCCTKEDWAVPGHVYTTEAWASPGRDWTTGACAGLDVLTLQRPQLHLDLSGLQEHVMFLDMSTLQRPVLHLDEFS